MDWQKYARYSRYHPDNLNKLPHKLPSPVAAPPPVVEITAIDKSAFNAWGHRLCCETPFGPNETTCRIKADVRRPPPPPARVNSRRACSLGAQRPRPCAYT
jgi:hypothetical protein